MKKTVKRLSGEEKSRLNIFIASKGDEKKNISRGEVNDLAIKMASLSPLENHAPRSVSTLWSYVKKAAEITDRVKASKRGAREKLPKKAAKTIRAVGLPSGAKIILDELKPIMAFMNKPSNYLAPFEVMMAENVQLAEAVENSNTALQKANAAIEKADATVKPASERIKQLEGDVERLKKFLVPAKKSLRLTCDIRRDAIALMKYAEEQKKKDGTDFYAFLQELEDEGLLKE